MQQIDQPKCHPNELRLWRAAPVQQQRGVIKITGNSARAPSNDKRRASFQDDRAALKLARSSIRNDGSAKRLQRRHRQNVAHEKYFLRAKFSVLDRCSVDDKSHNATTAERVQRMSFHYSFTLRNVEPRNGIVFVTKRNTHHPTATRKTDHNRWHRTYPCLRIATSGAERQTNRQKYHRSSNNPGAQHGA